MNILFTVCGRAGSKEIKNKNIRNFLGIPLPYYTFAAISQYMREFCTDSADIAVNTDSDELISISESNPYVPVNIIERKEELAGDRVPKTAVILDTYLQMTDRTHKEYGMVVDLDLTSPLRTAEDIDSLIKTQKLKNADVTFSVTDSRRNPYFNMVMECEKGVRKVLTSNYVARQQAPQVYDMNASMYAYNSEFLKTGKGVLDGYCEVIKMFDTGILDLDHENDFELMEVIAKYLFKNNGLLSKMYKCVKEVLR
nr:acylneuraminate cytidylyltransferase family protein [uncultured Flavobacterium sp.]